VIARPRIAPIARCGAVMRTAAAMGFLLIGAAAPARAGTYNAGPGNYTAKLPLLQPGDTLLLAPGTYTQGLTLWNMSGLPGAPIEIRGPSSGPAAVFTGRSCCNTVSLRDAAYLTIRNLTIDGLGLAVDGVKAESTGASAHDIVLENLTIVNHGANQQIVGINTKCPAWNWVIRRCVVIGAGTGLYLGDSNGGAPFVAGIIEDNLVRDTIGYNMEIKHQLSRPSLPGMPMNAKTIIRRNVWSKASGASTGGNARPCVLVGHWPLSGPGSADSYEIRGNFFWQNQATTERLFQGEGNIALYQNLFVNDNGDAISIQPHNDVPRTIRVFNNTVVAKGAGIQVTGGSTQFTQEVTANAVFASPAISGGVQQANVTAAYSARSSFLTNPAGAPGVLDLYPLAGMLIGPPAPAGSINTYANWDRDWNDRVNDGTHRGAYAGSGSNPGWLPVLSRPGAPPEIPDGRFVAGTPVTAARLDPAGTSVAVTWDASCRVPSAHLVWGDLAVVASLQPQGSACGLSGGVFTWSAPSGDLWFLVVADDLGDAEGSWGRDSSGAERASGRVSGQCGAIFRDNGGGC